MTLKWICFSDSLPRFWETFILKWSSSCVVGIRTPLQQRFYLGENTSVLILFTRTSGQRQKKKKHREEQGLNLHFRSSWFLCPNLEVLPHPVATTLWCDSGVFVPALKRGRWARAAQGYVDQERPLCGGDLGSSQRVEILSALLLNGPWFLHSLRTLLLSHMPMWHYWLILTSRNPKRMAHEEFPWWSTSDSWKFSRNWTWVVQWPVKGQPVCESQEENKCSSVSHR